MDTMEHDGLGSAPVARENQVNIYLSEMLALGVTPSAAELDRVRYMTPTEFFQYLADKKKVQMVDVSDFEAANGRAPNWFEELLYGWSVPQPVADVEATTARVESAESTVEAVRDAAGAVVGIGAVGYLGYLLGGVLVVWALRGDK